MNAKKIFLIFGLAASLVTRPTLNAGFMPKIIEENPRMTAALTSGTAALLAGSMILAPKTRAKIQRALNRMIKRSGPAASASDIALASATIMAAIGAAGLGGYSVMGRKKAAPAQEQANPLSDDIQRAAVASTVTMPESNNPAEAPEIAAKKARAAREIQRRFRGYKGRIAAEEADPARAAKEAEAGRIAAEEAEAARVAAEKAEAARIAAEEAEAARIAAEEAEATRKADAAFNYTTPDSYKDANLEQPIFPSVVAAQTPVKEYTETSVGTTEGKDLTTRSYRHREAKEKRKRIASILKLQSRDSQAGLRLFANSTSFLPQKAKGALQQS